MREICPSVEPFQQCSTIANLALSVWRTNFLLPNKFISLEGPLNNRQMQSYAALRFFKFFSKLTGKQIRTAEWLIGEHCPVETNYRIDGLMDNNTAIEFQGCFYHGELNLFF